MRASLLVVFSIVLLVLHSPGASAASGRQLLDDCTGAKTNQLACLYFIGGYVAGASQVYSENSGKKLPGHWCEPEKITWSERRNIVLNYIRDDLRRYNMNAKEIILESHRNVFSCD